MARIVMRAAIFLFPVFFLTVAPEPLLAQPTTFDAVVESAMTEFEVPGLALAIVKDGQVVVAKGYGVRELGEEAPVDEHTRFGIASNTKAFTASALGILVEDGGLEWDAPVVEYLPWFQMWDPWVTREITVRDLLVHRSGLGLGQGDLLGWPPSTLERREIVRRIRYLEPVTSFRSAYAYDNILYHAAAVVIEEVGGLSWEAFVRTRIIEPVGMTDTRVSRASTHAGGNVATPHARIDGAVQAVAPFDAVNTNASGGINSTAADMARWLRVQLDSGRVAGSSRIFQPGTTRQLWTPVTPIPIAEVPPPLSATQPAFKGYALGFRIQDYRGRKIVTHTGGLPGYVSRLTMIPALNLGIVVLTNQESGAAFEAITYTILDHYLEAPPTDWVRAYAAVTAQRNEALEASRRATTATRRTDSSPSLDLDGYARTYRDAWYGDVAVGVEGGGLVMRFANTPLLVGDLEHWQFDTFVVRWWNRELRADAFVTFDLNANGSIARVRMEPASEEVDFSYDFQDLHLRPID
jgi:CubicO group peptidase (beta-lactamase class C family)